MRLTGIDTNMRRDHYWVYLSHTGRRFSKTCYDTEFYLPESAGKVVPGVAEARGARGGVQIIAQEGGYP